MESVHLRRVIEKNGELHLTGLPCEKGQPVEMYLHFGTPGKRGRLTARRLLRSGLVGLWQDREGLGASAAFARRLRDPSDCSVLPHSLNRVHPVQATPSPKFLALLGTPDILKTLYEIVSRDKKNKHWRSV